MTSTYDYDDAGNTTSRAPAGQSAQTLTWDGEGELAGVVQSGASVGSYVYTADGERLIRREGGVTTVYLPGGQELTLTTGTGVVAATRYYSFNGSTVAVRTGSTYASVSSLVADPHGTAEVAVANTTNVVTRRRMDPYGSPRGTSPTWSGDHGFLDKPTDTTGLVQVGARYYDPVIARFVSVDPIMDLTDPQQWHGYAYAGNNPVTYSDPSGLRPQEHDGQASKGEYQPRTGVPSWAPVPAAQTTRTVAPPVSTPATPTLERFHELEGDDAAYVALYDSVTPEQAEELGDNWTMIGTYAASYREHMVICAEQECAPPCPDLECQAWAGAKIVGGFFAAGLLGIAGSSALRWAARPSTAANTAGSIRAVNPRGGSMNCVNCAVATDATLAGSPASALLSGPKPIGVLEQIYGGSFKPVSGQAEMAGILSGAGNGARGIVYGSRSGGVGHVFNGVNQGGTIRFLDGQTGGAASFSGFDGFMFLRTN